MRKIANGSVPVKKKDSRDGKSASRVTLRCIVRTHATPFPRFPTPTDRIKASNFHMTIFALPGGARSGFGVHLQLVVVPGVLLHRME